MSLEIKIIKGEDAFKLLEDNSFISKWSTLASLQKTITINQEYSFVSTWYNQYKSIFLPVFILGFNKENEICGIIPLAQNINSHDITHAGAWQAEYKGWICRASVNETFPVQALIAIKNHFDIKIWHWGWMPPKSTKNWFYSAELKKENIYFKYKKQNSPFMNLLNEERIIKIKKNKSIKNQINRFSKRGDFYIERITSKEKAARLIDILEKQSDFRHLAIHNTAPFNDDPIKKSFHINRLDFQKDNHFTVLWSNNKPLAFNFGECDDETVILGLITYDPTEGKNSPGKIFLIKLAEFLKEEGYKYLDLTPGENSYKEWFSNDHQELYSPIVFFKKRNFIVSNIKKIIKKNLKVDIYKKYIFSTFKASIPTIIDRFIKSYNNTFVYYHLKLKAIDSHTKNNTNVHKNNYADLLLYNEENNTTKKTTLLSNALKQFVTDDILFSIVKNDTLAHYGWMTTKLRNQNYPEYDKHFNFSENSAVLYGFFTDHSFVNNNFLSLTIQRMIDECHQKEISDIYIGIFNTNISFINIIEKIGFKASQKLEQKKLLWKMKNKLTYLNKENS